MVLAFIPARGGSKGIPRKNLALLAGKPLIQYTLDAALSSTCIDDILLSTDNEEIAACAARCAPSTRYRRPAELAGDACPMIAAVQHAPRLARARARPAARTSCCVLQPTSPLRTAVDIDGAIASFAASGADTLAQRSRAWRTSRASAWRSADDGWQLPRAAAAGCRAAPGLPRQLLASSTVRCIWRAPRRSSGSGASSCPESRCSTRCRASGASTSTHRWIWHWPKPCSGCAGERCGCHCGRSRREEREHFPAEARERPGSRHAENGLRHGGRQRANSRYQYVTAATREAESGERQLPRTSWSVMWLSMRSSGFLVRRCNAPRR